MAQAAGITEEDPNKEFLAQRAKEGRAKAKELAEFAKLQQSQKKDGNKALKMWTSQENSYSILLRVHTSTVFRRAFVRITHGNISIDSYLYICIYLCI